MCQCEKVNRWGIIMALAGKKWGIIMTQNPTKLGNYYGPETGE